MKHLQYVGTYLLSLVCLSSSQSDTISVTPETGSTIYTSDSYILGTPRIKVTSDIPVSLMRFYHKGVTTNDVVSRKDFLVTVKSNCNPDIVGNVTLVPTVDERGFLTTLSIETDGTAVPSMLLPSSNFEASWDYTSYWCKQRPDVPYPTPSHGDDRKLEEDSDYPMNLIDEVEDESKPTSTNGLIHKLLKQHSRNLFEESEGEDTDLSCGITAEILYHGCAVFVVADAPIVGINNATLGLISRYETEDECKTHYESELSLMHASTDDNTENGLATVAPTLFGRECSQVVEGRPYIDANGNHLQADARTCEDNDMSAASWSTTTSAAAADSDLGTSSSSSQKWTSRGLGEHASIASFAAFTISLMTNNAPPDLIRDSLQAALDEIDHATTSFEMASVLSPDGARMEPGSLPPSSHAFQNDLETLVRSTFEEGCIDETLSALMAAWEAEEIRRRSGTTEALCDVGDDVDVCQRRDETEIAALTKIASDEARHAALAWRTVRWGCATVGEGSCEAMLGNILLARVGERLNNYDGVMIDYERIYDSLYPLIMGGSVSDDVVSDMDCGRNGDGLLEGHIEGVSLVERMADKVIHDVICSLVSNGSASNGVSDETLKVE